MSYLNMPMWVDEIHYDEPKVVPLFRDITESERRDQQLVSDLWREKREHEERLAEINAMLEGLIRG